MRRKWVKRLWVIVCCIVIVSMIAWTVGVGVAYGATYDVLIRHADVTFQPEKFFVGDFVRVYATVRNIGEQDVQGNAFFSENGTAIGTPPPFSVKVRGAEEEVWVDWQPAIAGDRQIFVRIVTAPETRDEDPTNNEMIIPVIVRDRPPPPPPPTLVAPSSSGSAGGTTGGTTALLESAPAPKAQPSAPPKAAVPAKAVIAPAPPKVAIVPAATSAPAPVPAVPAASPNPSEPHDAQPRPAAPPQGFDTVGLRELLGNPVSPWRPFGIFAAGAVAVGGLAILTTLFIRRRRQHGDTADDHRENLVRRSKRSS